MTDFRKPKAAVEHKPSKFDGFTIVATGKPYKHQKGSGRAEVFLVIKAGTKISEWTKECAKLGFDSNFAVGSLQKHSNGKECAYKFSDKDDHGRTYDQVKKLRQADPSKAEARAKKEAERKAAKDAKDKAKADAKVKAEADKKAKDEAKAKAEAEAKAKAAEGAKAVKAEASTAKQEAKKQAPPKKKAA